MTLSPYSTFCAGVLFPLHERLKGHDSVALRRRLELSQWWAPEVIERDRIDRLRSFLNVVGQRVPYYADLFKSIGFRPADVISVSDLQALPLLTKDTIRAQTERLKADGHGPLSRSNTGGSSGQPLVFFVGKDRKSHDVAAKWRATRWWGVDIGDPEAVVWGSPVELGAQDRIRRLRDGLMRSVLLPAFEMSEVKLDGFVAALRKQRPKMLFGYPSALTHIAKHCQQRGVDMTDLGIRVAFVTSERLYDDQRAAIGRAFNCPVANGYGGRDAGFIAHECPSGGMHLTAEDIIVELIGADGRPVGEGESGEVVVTHTATADFPFIRYRTGDMAIFDKRRCACGRGLPLLREIQGRTTDFVIAADGTVMHGLSLIYAVRDLPGIHAFKIIQESRALTRVQIVREDGFDPGCVAGIVEAFKKRLGNGVDIRVDLVDEISPEKSGKFRYVVSHAH